MEVTVIRAGMLTTVQDLGRRGLRGYIGSLVSLRVRGLKRERWEAGESSACPGLAGPPQITRRRSRLAF